MTSVCQTIKASSWSLLLLDERSQELIFEVVVSPAAERLKGKRLPAGQGVAGWVAAHGQALLLPDVQQDERFCADYERKSGVTTRSIACVPLKSADCIIGVIELINPFDEGFVDEDLLLLATIADFAAIAIENARNYQRIQQLVITDDLTGLYNARHMAKVIEVEVERAGRYNKDLSLVFIDLDFFKTVNDTRGHLVGSRLLSEFGDFLRKHIRKIDFAARYGGDEFVLVLPETPKAGALILCNNILESLRQHHFPCRRRPSAGAAERQPRHSHLPGRCRHQGRTHQQSRPGDVLCQGELAQRRALRLREQVNVASFLGRLRGGYEMVKGMMER